MPRNIRIRNEKRRMSPSIALSLCLRLVAEGERIRGWLPEPEALDAEEKRDDAGDRDRDVRDADRQPRELGDRVLPNGCHELGAPLRHEHADDPHADVAG